MKDELEKAWSVLWVTMRMSPEGRVEMDYGVNRVVWKNEDAVELVRQCRETNTDVYKVYFIRMTLVEKR